MEPARSAAVRRVCARPAHRRRRAGHREPRDGLGIRSGHRAGRTRRRRAARRRVLGAARARRRPGPVAHARDVPAHGRHAADDRLHAGRSRTACDHQRRSERGAARPLRRRNRRDRRRRIRPGVRRDGRRVVRAHESGGRGGRRAGPRRVDRARPRVRPRLRGVARPGSRRRRRRLNRSRRPPLDRLVERGQRIAVVLAVRPDHAARRDAVSDAAGGRALRARGDDTGRVRRTRRAHDPRLSHAAPGRRAGKAPRRAARARRPVGPRHVGLQRHGAVACESRLRRAAAELPRLDRLRQETPQRRRPRVGGGDARGPARREGMARRAGHRRPRARRHHGRLVRRLRHARRRWRSLPVRSRAASTSSDHPTSTRSSTRFRRTGRRSAPRSPSAWARAKRF